MKKTKIEWCDSTWNPITGCYHRCEYCYARRIAKRFSYDGETLDVPAELQRVWIQDSKGSGAGNHILKYPVETVNGRKVQYPFGFAPTFHRYRLGEPERWTKPRNIFVCSMADMFGEWVPDSWIEEVFAACEKAPQHNYIFLTKNPKKYLDLECKCMLPRSDRFWFGTTITKPEECYASLNRDFHYFLSIEPLLEPLKIEEKSRLPEWIIVGAETGNRKNKVVPEKEWIEAIVEQCDRYNIPVFMKDSLIPIVGEENMRREFPVGLKAR